MSSEDFRRLRTGHASCGRLSRVRVWALFTVPIVAVTACIAITKNEKSYAIQTQKMKNPMLFKHKKWKFLCYEHMHSQHLMKKSPPERASPHPRRRPLPGLLYAQVVKK